MVGYHNFRLISSSILPIQHSADKESGNIYLYSINPKIEEGKPVPLHTLSLHSSPVKLMKFNFVNDTVVSIDEAGLIEYWSPVTYNMPDTIRFEYKTDTDLYEFAKVRYSLPSVSLSLTHSSSP
mgnify:FL=1